MNVKHYPQLSTFDTFCQGIMYQAYLSSEEERPEKCYKDRLIE